MRFKSSGLGKTELKGHIAGFSPVGKTLLVLYIDTDEPVKWHLRAAVERKDIPIIVKGLLKPSILLHTIRTLFYLKKNPNEVDDLDDAKPSS